MSSSTDEKDRDTVRLSVRDRKVLRLTNTVFANSMYWRTYRQTNQSTRYNQIVSKKVGRCYKAMDVQLRSKHFDLADPIMVLSFLTDF